MKTMDVYWKALGTAGFEHLLLQYTDDGVRADGIVLRYHNGTGVRFRYRIDCDRDWRVRQLSVQPFAEATAPVSLTADGAGNWYDAEGQALTFLQGCIDVDVMATPFTNTLPLQRLGLSSGESREIDVAYVTIPNFQVQRAPQRYTCLTYHADKSSYLYESIDSGFKAELTVDANQLVTTYEGIWERVFVDAL
jgi:uncharacterized protein